jgi:hypothetical protein
MREAPNSTRLKSSRSSFVALARATAFRRLRRSDVSQGRNAPGTSRIHPVDATSWLTRVGSYPTPAPAATGRGIPGKNLPEIERLARGGW